MSVTPEEIAKWKTLERAATTGPWVKESDRLEGWIVRQRKLPGDRWTTPICGECTQGEQDAAFIAAARDAVPRLLDEVFEMDAERAMLLGSLEEANREVERLRALAESAYREGWDDANVEGMTDDQQQADWLASDSKEALDA